MCSYVEASVRVNEIFKIGFDEQQNSSDIVFTATSYSLSIPSVLLQVSCCRTKAVKGI